jgi:hypothetical protein
VIYPVLFPLLLADATAAVKPHFFTASNIVRDLPGRLDSTFVLQSNSPELIEYPGIIVSTFPGAGKKSPKSHLNYPVTGRFDIFAHHVAKKTGSDHILYLGLLVKNAGKKTANLKIHQAATFMTSPDAPFYALPAFADNSGGRVFAGPGDRLSDWMLRGLSQPGWPASVSIPPGQIRVLYNLPVPVFGARSRNTRSTLIRATTDAPLYLASLSTYSASGTPSDKQWEAVLNNGSLAGPRDRVPTKPSTSSKPIYGRVAGVSRGSRWKAYFTDDPSGALRLTIPQPNQSISYVVSTVEQGAFGTKQLQSAPLAVRYNDTSYKAHGNYAVEYNLFVPLHNNTNQVQPVTMSLQTPFKSNTSKSGLLFSYPPQTAIWFRGTLRLRYKNESGQNVCRYLHVVQHRADAGQPFLSLQVKPGETNMVAIDFIYPPDCTPPQILTISNPGTLTEQSAPQEFSPAATESEQEP